MPASRFNRNSLHGYRGTAGLALTLLLLGGTIPGLAASQSSQPILKAIDPATAKMDPAGSAVSTPTSPNPLGRVKGAPISQSKKGKNSGVPASLPAYPAPQMVPGGDPGAGSGAPFPSQSMIPDFDKPLPPPADNNSAPSGFLTQPVPDGSTSTRDEARLTKLEQTAFGSSYPEHEVEDRLDHLEKEVFGAEASGAVEPRIAKLEVKLGGSGAFTQSPVSSPDPIASAPGQSQWQLPDNGSAQPIAQPMQPPPDAEQPPGNNQFLNQPGYGAPPANQFPTQSGYVAPPTNQFPTQSGFAPPPANQFPTQSGYGAPPANQFPTQSGFAPPPAKQFPTQSGYGAPPANQFPTQSGFAPPPANQFPTQSGYGAPPANQFPTQSGFAPPPANQFPTQSGFAPPPANQFPTQSGYGAPPANQFPTQSGFAPPPANQFPTQSGFAPPPANQFPTQSGFAPPPANQFPAQSGFAPPPANQFSSYPDPRAFPTTQPGLPTPPPAVAMLGHAKQKKERDERSPKEQSGKSSNAGELTPDYFDSIKQFGGDRVARWKNLPVRIHLPENSPESWQRSLDLGIKRWGEHLPLKVVPSTEPADIDVVWVNKLVPQYLGVTRLVTKEGKMEVQMFLLRPTFYLPEIPERVLANVFLHELGHGLGIFGHSSSRHDLMYAAEVTPAAKGKPAEIRFAGLSERDINTLKHIYASAAIENLNLPQPMEWGYKI